MNRAYLGIDISKKTFHAALIVSQKEKPFIKNFSNDQKGFNNLVNWLKDKSIDIHVCMEATGRYGEALSTFMYEQKYIVSVVNPAKVKGFSSSELSRCKTDKADAQLIARYCMTVRPSAWQPEPKHIRDLRELYKQADDLKFDLQRAKNRNEMAAEIVQKTAHEHIDFLKKAIKKLEKQINEFIDNNPELNKGKKLLVSIPGVSDKTAPKILCLLGNENKFDSAKKVSAFVGLNPKERQSGTSVRGRGHISKIGDVNLRKALYMPAIVAIKHNPTIKKFAERLKKNGKSKMVIIIAAMKKLLYIMYGVLKNNSPYTENWEKEKSQQMIA